MFIGFDSINFKDFNYCSIYEEELDSKLFHKYLKNKVSFFNIVSSRVFEAGLLEKKIWKLEE